VAKRDRLPEIEIEYGEPLIRLIPRLLNKYGNHNDVATELNVHPNTIKRWMKKERIQRISTVQFKLPEADHAAS
jgi:IS30 family transposase